MDERSERERWARVAGDYNRPPDTPSEDMWSAIEARLDARGGEAGPSVTPLPVRRRAWFGWAAAAGIALALGIGIGRYTASGPAEGTSTAEVEPASEAVSEPVRRLAAEHLGQSESLLAMVRVDARSGTLDRDLGNWSRSLLLETRMLLDSPAGRDPELRSLLEDLELVLVQVALLGEGGVSEGDRSRAELSLIASGIEDGDLLTRIQAVLPTARDRIGT